VTALKAFAVNLDQSTPFTALVVHDKLSGEFLVPGRKECAIWQRINQDPGVWYVYAHYMDNQLMYIGKGRKGRFQAADRDALWDWAYNECRTIVFRIVSWHDTSEYAYGIERHLIGKYNPPLNNSRRTTEFNPEKAKAWFLQQA